MYGRVEGLPAEVGAGRLELILIRERSLITLRSGIDITIFGEGEKLRIASKSSSEFNAGRGLSPGHVLHPADVAKLGVCRTRAHGGGGHWRCYRL